MRISDWSSDVCSSDLAPSRSIETSAPCAPLGTSALIAVSAARCIDRSSVVHTSSGALVSSIRSEEHTSELQSLMRISYAVFCLKKKKQTREKNNIYSESHYT